MANIKRKGNRCVIYVRVSKRRGDQTSLSSQRKECEQFATMMGWVIVFVFVEEGKSAYRKNSRRPQFDAAMSMIERKQADVFLVWKLDRFYRDGTEFQKAWNRIDESGALFASVMEPHIDTTSASGRQYLSNLAFAAEIESENRSQRTTAWHNERNSYESGAAVNGGPRPFGYDRTGKSKMAINESEAKLIRTAAKRFVAGESLRGIHRSLRIPSTQGNGLMSDRGLRNVLTNPTTYGLKRTATGSFVKGDWKAILDPEQFGVIVSRFDDPSRRMNQTDNKVVHLLGGLLICECGKRLASRSNRNRYQCRCGTSVNESRTDEFVTDRLFEIVTPEVWKGWRVKGHGFDTAVRERIERDIEEINMRVVRGKISWAAFDAMNADLQNQLALSTSDEPFDIPAVDDLAESWKSLSVIDKRKVIRQAFESITVSQANGSYDPGSRIAIRPR